MSFEAIASFGPHCEGDTLSITFCNCPAFNLIAIRPVPVSTDYTFTATDGGVDITGAGVGAHSFEVRCCVRLEQDFDNPYTQVFFPDR